MSWIATSRYPIHSKLPPERELASILRLSRGKLREALQRLEADGVIWRHVGIGTYVGSRPASTHSNVESLSAATTLAEILEARLSVEPVVSRFAAIRAQSGEIAMMEQYWSSGLGSTTWREWERWDELFHRAVAEGSGNGILINTVDQLLRIKTHARWTVRFSAELDRGLVKRYSREHEAIFRAIENKDPDAAENAMRRHISALALTIGPVIANR